MPDTDDLWHTGSVTQNAMLTISVSLCISSVAPEILSSPTNILFTHLTFLARNSEFFANSLLNKELFLGEQQCIWTPHAQYGEHHSHNKQSINEILNIQK